MAEKTYIIEMQIARGIGIVLVTLGHSEPIKDTFPQIFNFIYSFHMPLFFFMAGFFSSSAAPTGSLWEEYKKLFHRIIFLGIPYVTISLTYTFIKFGLPHLAKRQVILENVVANIFLYPTMNPALFLWFVYILIMMKLITPILSRSNQYVVFLLLLLSQIFPLRLDLFGIGVALQFLIYYYLGLKTFSISEGFQLILKQRALTFAFFLLLLFSYHIFRDSELTVTKMFAAGFGSLWILSICFSLTDYLPVRLLEHCGRHSLQIYLLQYYFIFSLYLLLSYLQVYDGFIVLANFVIGLVGPLIVVKYVFPSSRVLALAFGGMRGMK
jgi:fucose 4-O-acetylase-like acetyltransferase